MGKRSDYGIVRVEEDRVFIIDLDLGNLSVTNDASMVYYEIQTHFPGKRLIYRDTMGRWDEITFEFPIVNFKIYQEHLPNSKEIEEIKKFPHSEFLRTGQNNEHFLWRN